MGFNSAFKGLIRNRFHFVLIKFWVENVFLRNMNQQDALFYSQFISAINLHIIKVLTPTDALV
jgi:hypothetical protein